MVLAIAWLVVFAIGSGIANMVRTHLARKQEWPHSSVSTDSGLRS